MTLQPAESRAPGADVCSRQNQQNQPENTRKHQKNSKTSQKTPENTRKPVKPAGKHQKTRKTSQKTPKKVKPARKHQKKTVKAARNHEKNQRLKRHGRGQRSRLCLRPKQPRCLLLFWLNYQDKRELSLLLCV